LELPGKSLAAKEERHKVEAGIRDAFVEIERQLRSFKTTLRREHLWKRPARREKTRQKKIDAVPFQQRNREMFFSLVSPQLNGLYQFVRHELARFQAVGDLMEDELTPEDVVDAALLRAYREFVKDPAGRDMRAWLIQLATEQLEAEVKRSKSQRDRTVHIEDDIPETPPTEAVSTLGDEILDFYQPDEDLKLEDIIPDVEVPSPEQEAETEELRQCVNLALAEMPREWRRALLLRHVEGLASAELARTIGRAEPEIEDILGSARQYLRQKLIESGFRFRQGDSRPTVQAKVAASSEKRKAKGSGKSG
jgi:RNA polymerase sigma factor (sigma-70 family)